LERDGADVFTTELRDEAAGDLDGLERLGDFVEPPSFDARIVNQHALFPPRRGRTARRTTGSRNNGLWKRVIVPAELKWEVRDKLDLANVTERVLFPGLDGLSRWLKRYYLPQGLR
jgi:hypothetical protein